MTTCIHPHNIYSMQAIPVSERPRERLLKHGPEAMSSTELLAIILGSGTKDVPVIQLAQTLLTKFGSLQAIAKATVQELCEVKGLGQAKAIQLKATFDLGIRASRGVPMLKYRADSPAQVYYYVKAEMELSRREIFKVLLLDTKCYIIAEELVSIGTLSKALAHPREIFYTAIRNTAASLVLIHNHPSGDPTPSKEDLDLTQKLIAVGRLIGIPIQDHLIIGHNSYMSLRQKGINFHVPKDRNAKDEDLIFEIDPRT